MTKIFSIKEAVGFSWREVKKHFWFFIGFSAILLIVSGLPSLFEETGEDGVRTVSALYYPVSFVSWFFGILIAIGITKICLDIVHERGEKPKIKELFSHTNLFIKMFLSSLLYALIVSGPMIVMLLIFALSNFLLKGLVVNVLNILLALIGIGTLIFMIIYSIRLSFYNYFIVEGFGVVDSLKNSFKITKGMVWSIFVFYVVLVLLNLLGVVALFVGLFVTIPITYLAETYVYKKLKEANFGTEPIIANSQPEMPIEIPTPPEIK